MINQNNLLALVQYDMPFGKYKGCLLADLPEEYLLWFAKKGFPNGRLGELLQLALLLNIDGTKKVLDPLRTQKPTNGKAKPKIQIKFD